MNLVDNIFRNYDIRGVYPDQINEEVALNIGKALGTIIIRKGGSKILVGRDIRKSSRPLSESLIKGLASTGCNVTDAGLSLTPIIHFCMVNNDFDLGIEVTASHNPKEYNGFRLDYRGAVSFYGKDVQLVKELVEKGDFEAGEGSVVEQDMFTDYLNYMKEQFHFENHLRVVLDCGNATSSYFLPKIFDELGINLVPMYCDPDPDFPHGIPDPENLEVLDELKKKVLDEDADLGVVLDPDTDRFGFVDETGLHYDNDKTLMLFVDDVLKANKSKKIVYDVKCTGLLHDFIVAHGGEPKMIRTGHPYFTNETIVEGAVLGGEFSGHTYFADRYFGYDDGIYSILRVIEKVIEAKRPLSYLMLSFPMRVHSTEIKLSCPDDLKFGLLDAVSVALKEIPEVLDVNETDGVRVQVTPTKGMSFFPTCSNHRMGAVDFFI